MTFLYANRLKLCMWIDLMSAIRIVGETTLMYANRPRSCRRNDLDVCESTCMRIDLYAKRPWTKRCIWTVRDTYSFVCWGAFRISRVESYLAGKVLLDLMQCIALLLNVHLDIDIQCLNFSTYNTWTFFWKKRKHLMSFLSRHWAWSNRENSRQPLKQLEQVQLESSCRESTRILERIKSTLIRSNSDQLSLWRGFYWQFGWQKEISPIWFPQIHSQIEIIDILVRLYKC